MEKIEAFLNWKRLIESAIPDIQTVPFVVVDDYLKNGTYYTVFSQYFKSIKERFSDFELAIYSMSDQDRLQIKVPLDELLGHVQEYIKSYEDKYFPVLFELIEKESRASYPVIINKEEFLQTNRVKRLFDYCQQTITLIEKMTIEKKIPSNEKTSNFTDVLTFIIPVSSTFNITDNKTFKNPNSPTSDIPNFKQFLILPDGTDIEIFNNYLKEEFKGRRGKGIALVVYSLIDLKFMTITKRKTIYNSIRKSYECEIGTDSGINKYFNSSTKDGSLEFMGSQQDLELMKTKIKNYLEVSKHQDSCQ